MHDFDKLDMANLNLFGVPVAEAADAMKDTASSQETQKVLSDLIDIVEQSEADIHSYNIRKSFVYYDVSSFKESWNIDIALWPWGVSDLRLLEIWRWDEAKGFRCDRLLQKRDKLLWWPEP